MEGWKKFFSSTEAIWSGPEISFEQVKSGSSLKFRVDKGTAGISEGKTGLAWPQLADHLSLPFSLLV